MYTPSGAPTPRCSRYQAARPCGSFERKKKPPIPVTAMVASWCSSYRRLGTASSQPGASRLGHGSVLAWTLIELVHEVVTVESVGWFAAARRHASKAAPLGNSLRSLVFGAV